MARPERRWFLRSCHSKPNAALVASGLTTTPNASVSPYHHRMPLILRTAQLGAWLGDDWLSVLEKPDHALLEKIQNQAELF